MKTNCIEAGVLKIKGFGDPAWDEFSGENGAYVSKSSCGKVEAIAEPVEKGYLCFLIRIKDVTTLEQCFIS